MFGETAQQAWGVLGAQVRSVNAVDIMDSGVCCVFGHCVYFTGNILKPGALGSIPLFRF